jgi:hypothetical protein
MVAVWHVESEDAKMDDRAWIEKSKPVNDIELSTPVSSAVSTPLC